MSTIFELLKPTPNYDTKISELTENNKMIFYRNSLSFNF